MDAFEVIKVCIRRWWVLLPVVLLAVGAGYGLVKQQKPLYYGFGGFALVYTYGSELAPGAADPRNENPLANGGAELLGEAVMSDFSSAASQARYRGEGHPGYRAERGGQPLQVPGHRAPGVLDLPRGDMGPLLGGRSRGRRLRHRGCSPVREGDPGPCRRPHEVSVHHLRDVSDPGGRDAPGVADQAHPRGLGRGPDGRRLARRDRRCSDPATTQATAREHHP